MVDWHINEIELNWTDNKIHCYSILLTFIFKFTEGFFYKNICTQ